MLIESPPFPACFGHSDSHSSWISFWGAGHTHLFLTKFKKGIGPRGIEKMVEKYLKEASIHSASAHTLRHTFATHTIKKGTKLEVVRQALGHESLETTSIYVHLAREMMDKELQENAL